VTRSDGLVERYEEFRQGALGGYPRGIGCIVLKTQGMVSWVRSAQERDIPPREKTSSVSPLPAGHEVVRVLAGMVWALHKEA
jgi:hypothetical protein